MTLLAVSVIGVLIMIALIHIYWGFGGEIGLDNALPTDEDGKRLLNPPSLLTLLVAVVIFGFAYVAYALYHGSADSTIYYAGWLIAFIFLARSIGDFKMVGMFKKIRNTTFSYHDTKYYVPLTLFLGIYFAYLTYNAG